MDIEAMAEAARRAGHIASATFGLKIPDDVDPGQVVYDAAAAVPVLWRIRNDEYVDPVEIQPHIARAAALQEKLKGSEPFHFLQPVIGVLGEVAGTPPAQAAGRIRQELSSPKAREGVAKLDPFLATAGQFNVGPKLEDEIVQFARRVRDVARANSRGNVDPDILARSIYSTLNETVSGQAPLALARGLLGTYTAQSGSAPKLPPYPELAKHLKAGGEAIMHAVDEALPESERDPAFLASLSTSFRGQIGSAVGHSGLRAIKTDVHPLITNIVAMMPKNPNLARQQLHHLFSAA